MVDTAEVRRLQMELARASFLALRGEQWVVATRSFLQAGGTEFGRNHFERDDGSRGSVLSTPEILELWTQLRAAMTDGDAGTWLSAEIRITSQGRFDCTYNWDRRPWSNAGAAMLAPPEPGAGPSDAEWSEDLRFHPRSAERTPDWLAAIAAASPASPAVSGSEVEGARFEPGVDELRLRSGSPATTGSPEVQRLQTELARASFLALQGEDWAVAHQSRLGAGLFGFGRNHFVRADGSENSIPLPRAVRDLWPRLRAAMTDDDRGAWLSAELEITSRGRFEFTFNWDRRPWMNTRTALLDPPEHRTTGPSDEDWREELRLHPRSPERTPDWLAAIVAAGPPPPAPDPEVDPHRMRQRFGALLAQPGWPDLGDAVQRLTAELVRTFEWSPYDPEEPPEDDPEIEVLVQDVVSSVMRERLDPMPAEGLRGLYDGALGAGFVPRELLGLPADAEPAADASDDVARRTVVELVARLTESLVVRR